MSRKIDDISDVGAGNPDVLLPALNEVNREIAQLGQAAASLIAINGILLALVTFVVPTIIQDLPEFVWLMIFVAGSSLALLFSIANAFVVAIPNARERPFLRFHDFEAVEAEIKLRQKQFKNRRQSLRASINTTGVVFLIVVIIVYVFVLGAASVVEATGSAD